MEEAWKAKASKFKASDCSFVHPSKGPFSLSLESDPTYISLSQSSIKTVHAPRGSSYNNTNNLEAEKLS